MQGAGYTPSLERFVRRHGYHITPRSRGRRPHPGQGPTLVYLPDAALLEIAAGYARGGVLCAVESSSFRLAGWTTATAAVNLDTTEPASALSDEVTKLLDRVAFYGNNGWSDQFGKQQACRLLDELHGIASLDADFIASYMIGKGRSGKGAMRLHAMANRLNS